MAKAQERKKRKLLEELQQIPIVHIACKRVGIPRSTYYRWFKEDRAFATQATEALAQGVDVVNDVAESKVISGVNSGEQKYVFYWLNNRHPSYNLQKAPPAPSDLDARAREYDILIEKYENALSALIDDPANQPENLPDTEDR